MINFNSFGGGHQGGFNPMSTMGGGFGSMSALNISGSSFTPAAGFDPMAGALNSGFNPAAMMGGPMNGAMGGLAVDPTQQMMSMMSNMMMMMVSKMLSSLASGQMPMSMGPNQFGPMGAGMPQGSPLNSFLGGGGGGGNFGGGKVGGSKPGGGGKARGGGKSGGGNSGASSSSSAAEAGPSVKLGKDGKIGDVNVGKLINAIPSVYHPHAKKHWPSIVAEAQKQGIKNKSQLAYILATTVHESGAGKYMEEIASGSAYEGRSDLGNTKRGDGVKYKGRGYVQITGRNNYTKWGKKLGMNLVGNPELAERPAVAAKILVGGMKEGSFTGKGLSDYLGKGKTDFNGARAIVNGSDKAGTFAATAKSILNAMS